MAKVTGAVSQPYKDFGMGKCELAGGGEAKSKWLQGVDDPAHAEKLCDEDETCMGYSTSDFHTLLWMSGPLQRASQKFGEAHCMGKVTGAVSQSYKDLGDGKCELAGGGTTNYKYLSGVDDPAEAEKRCEDEACMGYSTSDFHTLLVDGWLLRTRSSIGMGRIGMGRIAW